MKANQTGIGFFKADESVDLDASQEMMRETD